MDDKGDQPEIDESDDPWDEPEVQANLNRIYSVGLSTNWYPFRRPVDRDAVNVEGNQVQQDPARWAAGMFKRPSTIVLLGVLVAGVLVVGAASIISLLPSNA